MLYCREQKKWTQFQLAAAAGVGQSTISMTESGERQSKGSLPAIAEALGVSYKWLLTGTGEMKAPSDWPYETFTPEQYLTLEKSFRDEIEDKLLGAITRQRKTGTHS